MGRLLRRDRGLHALIVALLGLGIGSATLVFSVVNEVLLKPLPVRDPGNLYLLARTSPGEFRPDDYFDVRHYREVVLANPLVQAAVAEQMADADSIVLLREGGRLVQAQSVSPNYFGGGAQLSLLAVALQRRSGGPRPDDPSPRPALHDRGRAPARVP
jgi:putative ABC transport system permease protein